MKQRKQQQMSGILMSHAGLAAVQQVPALNQAGESKIMPIVDEQPLTIKVDGEELVTLMTLGTHPEKLVLGYLRNQTLFDAAEDIESIQVDWDREIAEVVSKKGKGLAGFDTHRKVVTTGCGQGTILSCTLDKIYSYRHQPLVFKQSDIYRILAQISKYNDVYRQAGSVHGCALCAEGEVLYFVEDVGRHNAMDTIAGEMWLNDVSGQGKFFYSTGRLTSEIVMKAALMGVQVLISRNGATHMGYQLALDLGVSLIIRAKSRHFIALNAEQMVFDQKP